MPQKTQPTKHIPFISLSSTARQEIRRKAIHAVEQGYTHKKVAELFGVRRETVTIWYGKRTQLQKQEYKGKKRGRELYEQRTLTQKQEQKIQKKIETKTPQDFKLPYALWNRKAIQFLIQQETKTKVWLQTVSKYTKRWGYTSQRPAKYAYEQDKEKIREWKEVTYKKIVTEAKKNKAEIHFSDETGVALSTFYAKGYAPKGKTPVIRLKATQGHISVISSISNRGDLRFMLYKGAMHSQLFIVFLKRLIHDTEKKIYLIVDNLKVHKSKLVQAFVKTQSTRLKIFFPTSVCSTIKS
jgi:transposase